MASSEDLALILTAEGISDERVLDAVRAIPRHGFVPAESSDRAYEDVLLPIPHGQVTTQPSLIARMLAALALSGHERALEIGTGHRFQTAVLAVLAREVWSVPPWSFSRTCSCDSRSRVSTTASVRKRAANPSRGMGGGPTSPTVSSRLATEELGGVRMTREPAPALPNA